MVDAALELFTDQGYDETTMEQVAEAAEVAPSTLYRYFPSKDLLLLDRLVESIDLAAGLRRRPPSVPLDVALGEVLLDVAGVFDDPGLQITAVRRIVDGAPVPRARIFDVYLRARTELEQAIAERLDLAPDALVVRVTAGLAMDVVQISDEIRREQGWDVPAVETVRAILREMPGLDVPRPALPRAARRRTG
jgi:AcrR family transcriptional regulator